MSMRGKIRRLRSFMFNGLKKKRKRRINRVMFSIKKLGKKKLKLGVMLRKKKKKVNNFYCFLEFLG